MGWDEVRKARERLKGEQGAVLKDWGGKLPVALIYPNSYHVGMSNLGMQTIYRLLNCYPDIVCERVFWEPDGEPVSLESQRPLRDFAVLAFSVSFELDYLNIAPLLKKGGIPVFAAERDESDPLILGGGACIITNPAPVSPFFDCLGIGEAEALLPAMLQVISQGISESRPELLAELARLPGIYVPQRFSGSTVARQWAADLDGFPAVSTVLTRDTELGDLYLMEVQRGCGWACRFCLVSSAFRPMRFRSMESLLALAEEGMRLRKRFGLVGPSVAAHPRVEELAAALLRMGAEISISSLRVRPLPEGLLQTLAESGARTVTLAPEAGSQRLRQLICKGIGEEDILRAVDGAARRGFRNLKLYFMVGLPTETDEDIEAIIELNTRCKGIIERRRSACRITINLAPFVPKPGTPFQLQPMAPLPTLENRLSRVKNALAGKGIRVNSESPAWSEVQAVLSRGDASLAGPLAKMDRVSLSAWRKGMREAGIDTGRYAYTEWQPEAKLPWAVRDLNTPALPAGRKDLREGECIAR